MKEITSSRPPEAAGNNANYRFENWDDLSTEGKEINTDTVTLGAAARLAF